MLLLDFGYCNFDGNNDDVAEVRPTAKEVEGWNGANGAVGELWSWGRNEALRTTRNTGEAVRGAGGPGHEHSHERRPCREHHADLAYIQLMVGSHDM